MTCKSGLEANDLDLITDADTNSQGSVPAQPSQMALAQEWQAVLDQSMTSLSQGISLLSSAQILPPLVGHELADAAGKVVADSELAWPKELLVVLRSDQQDLVSAWQEHGWQVVLLAEDGLSINGQPWHEVVLANLQR